MKSVGDNPTPREVILETMGQVLKTLSGYGRHGFQVDQESP
jgi:hypothetical protein